MVWIQLESYFNASDFSDPKINENLPKLRHKKIP